MNNWLQITFTMPVFIAVTLVLILVATISAGVVFLKKQRTKVKSILDENENLQKNRKDYEYFLQNISHEVSNPLQSIQTNLDNMAHCSPSEIERWQQYYQIISTDIRRLANLTDGLRQVTRLEISNTPITREAVNLSGVIETVIMSLSDCAEEQGVRLRFVGLERPARVLGDRDNLERVFQNLLGNSIKYSKEAGGDVVISVQEENDWFCVRVKDTGIGIPEQDLPYIFSVAYRSPDTILTHRKGTGLGLVIVKRIIEQHGGHISIQSQLGQGTTVSFDLPKYIPAP